jgi:pyruvate/2-oxoacid:ferredoxin oxidoreductase beta subunit
MGDKQCFWASEYIKGTGDGIFSFGFNETGKAGKLENNISLFLFESRQAYSNSGLVSSKSLGYDFIK